MIIRGSETVTIKRKSLLTGTDDYGIEIESETTIIVKNCLIAFNATSEPIDINRDAVDAQLTLYMPKGTVIEDGDVFTIRGTDFIKNGLPADWVSPFPFKTGVVVQVRKRHG